MFYNLEYYLSNNTNDNIVDFPTKKVKKILKILVLQVLDNQKHKLPNP